MRSLFLKIFLWFWLAMTLVITATALVGWRARTDNDQPPVNMARPRQSGRDVFRLLAQNSANLYAARHPKGEAAADAPELVRTRREVTVSWWLYDTNGNLLYNESTPSIEVNADDVRELSLQAVGEERVQMLRLEPPADEQAAPAANNATPSTTNEAAPREQTVLMALQTRSSDGREFVFVSAQGRNVRVPPRSLERDALRTSRRYFPLASFLFLRGDTWSRTMRLAIMLLTAGVFCFLLARHITRPISALRGTADALAEGNLSARSDERVARRRDELGELGRDFNTMAARLEGLMSAQRRLLSDVSHELRSPLARLNIALELARRENENGDKSVSAKTLDRIERESQRLDGLVGQLLTLSRLENGGEQFATMGKQAVDMAQLLDEVVADVRFEAQSCGRDVIVLQRDAALVEGSRDLLRSAIENVLRNAVRFTAEGSAVEVRLTAPDTGPGAGWVTVQVRDHGPGVPEAALAQIFEPFYRVEDARDRVSGGIGLGLAIAQRAVNWHQGRIKAANAPDGGLIVQIELPGLGY